jgi:hypothetical protein
VASGGPELCHQLADALNQRVERAFCLYCPADKTFDVIPQFRKYRVRAATPSDVTPDSILVVPESAAPVVTWFPGVEVYFWWMSVDSFLIAAEQRGKDPDAEFVMVQSHVTRNLYQSDHARGWLKARGVTGERLSDRLAPEFLGSML